MHQSRLLRLPVLFSLFGLAIGTPSSTWAKDAPAATTLGPADFKADGYKLLAKQPRIVVPGYRMVFVVRNKTVARAGSRLANLGNSTASGSGMKTVTQAKSSALEIFLGGVDEARLRKIADQAYADFIAQLKASGREVLAVDQLGQYEGFKNLALSPAAVRKEPSISNSKGYLTVSPNGVPLWFTATDAAYGDKSAFDHTNGKLLNKLAIEASAVVLVPQIVIDFAKLSSSGNSMLRSDAEVGSDKGMTVIGEELVNTGLNVYKTINKFAADWRISALKKSFALSGDYGDIRTLTAEDDAAFQNSMTLVFGGQGTQHFKQSQVLVADPDKFEALAVQAAKTVNAAYARIVAENK